MFAWIPKCTCGTAWSCCVTRIPILQIFSVNKAGAKIKIKIKKEKRKKKKSRRSRPVRGVRSVRRNYRTVGLWCCFVLRHCRYRRMEDHSTPLTFTMGKTRRAAPWYRPEFMHFLPPYSSWCSKVLPMEILRRKTSDWDPFKGAHLFTSWLYSWHL